MAYRGETIQITLKGDDEFDLDSLDFVLDIHPDREYGSALQRGYYVNKDKMSKIGTNVYLAEIPFAITAELPVGLYTIEVLIKDADAQRRIYLKEGAFPLYDSVSKHFA